MKHQVQNTNIFYEVWSEVYDFYWLCLILSVLLRKQTALVTIFLKLIFFFIILSLFHLLLRHVDNCKYVLDRRVHRKLLSFALPVCDFVTHIEVSSTSHLFTTPCLTPTIDGLRHYHS